MTANTTHLHQDAYRWRVLCLGALTFTFVVATPHMSLPVLFDEISAEIGLNLVQVGWIWGMSAVMGILVGLIGGPMVTMDRSASKSITNSYDEPLSTEN